MKKKRKSYKEFLPSRLSIDPKTKFLATTDYRSTAFTIEKKLALIEALKQNPSVGYACKQAQINYLTYLRHTQVDPNFALAVKNTITNSLHLHKGDLEETMLSRGKTPGGYMDRITWLRRHFPEEYADKKTVTYDIDNQTKSLLQNRLNQHKQEQSIYPDPFSDTID